MKFWFPLLTFLALFSSLHAAEVDPCTLAGTININSCAKQKFESADRELNRAYSAVLKQLETYHDNGPATRKALIVSQRKWVEFRDADCTARQRLYQGGSVAAEIYLDCETKHTEQRIRELQPDSWSAG
jgi:uncharacterized protein YecT (DUF1311 family)